MLDKNLSLPASATDSSPEIELNTAQKLFRQRFNRAIAVIAVCLGLVGGGLILYGIPEGVVGAAVGLVLYCLQFAHDRLIS